MTVLMVLAVWVMLSVVVAFACGALITAGKGPERVADAPATEEAAAVAAEPDDVRRTAA